MNENRNLLKTELTLRGLDADTLCEKDNKKVTLSLDKSPITFSSSYRLPLILNDRRYCSSCLQKELEREEKLNQLQQKKEDLISKKMEIEKELSSMGEI